MERAAPGLGVDQAVTVEIEQRGERRTIHARVRSITERGLLLVPTEHGPVVEPGTPVAVTYFDRSGLYRFEADVIRQAEQGERSMQLTAPERLTRTQRRQYVRLDLQIPVACVVVDEATGALTPLDARSGDVGGGGMRLIAAEPVAEGAQIVLSFVLPRQPAVVAVAKVVVCEPRPDGTAVVRAAFHVISEQDRERIVGYVFDELRSPSRH